MDASERGHLLDKLADLVERDRAVLAVSAHEKQQPSHLSVLSSKSN